MLYWDILGGWYLGSAIGRMVGTLLGVAIVAFIAYSAAPLVLGFLVAVSVKERSFLTPSMLVYGILGRDTYH